MWELIWPLVKHLLKIGEPMEAEVLRKHMSNADLDQLIETAQLAKTLPKK